MLNPIKDPDFMNKIDTKGLTSSLAIQNVNLMEKKKTRLEQGFRQKKKLSVK